MDKLEREPTAPDLQGPPVHDLSHPGSRSLPYKDQSDETLAVLAEQGNNEAFDILLERYNQPVLRYIRTLVHNNEEIAQDLTQDAFIKAWQSMSTRNQKRPLHFRPWLYRIAYTTTIDYLRKYSLEKLIIYTEGTEDEHEKHHFQASKLEDDLCNKESIKAALDQVYPQYRQCIIMRYIKGYSFQDIAQVLGINETTVRANISYGRKQFTQIYLREVSDNKDINNTTRKEEK